MQETEIPSFNGFSSNLNRSLKVKRINLGGVLRCEWIIQTNLELKEKWICYIVNVSLSAEQNLFSSNFGDRFKRYNFVLCHLLL